VKPPEPRAVGPLYAIDYANTRDLSPLAINPAGRLKVLPTSFWAGTTAAERFALGARHGLYSYPTTELVERLTAIIDGRKAIEIGAGHGQLARALGITATDSKEQQGVAHKLLYGLQGQRTVKYGPDVVTMDGNTAVHHYQPQVVIACWVTQDATGAHWKPGSGKLNGIDEGDIIANCETYVFIGNEEVHADKHIWGLPHAIEYPDCVVSRAINGTRDFIAVWPGGNATIHNLAHDAVALTRETSSDRPAA